MESVKPKPAAADPGSAAWLASWMSGHRLTQTAAAEALGVSRRMLNYYLAGEKPIPKTVFLACLGWEAKVKK